MIRVEFDERHMSAVPAFFVSERDDAKNTLSLATIPSGRAHFYIDYPDQRFGRSSRKPHCVVILHSVIFPADWIFAALLC